MNSDNMLTIVDAASGVISTAALHNAKILLQPVPCNLHTDSGVASYNLCCHLCC